ncbi:Ti-type conjugative transfer relaxase TraA, partial [Novosphingobium sp. ERN07]|nr:Ti-type conjugative transfer relaxase TraA [Novosphingobium sp. ERN07]
IILTHTNDEVRELNDAARGRLRDAGELGMDVSIAAERGERRFASGDRIMFLRNERSLGVKNGTLGIVEHVTPQRMGVRTDDGRSVTFDTRDYAHLDHGYAATIHKAQGMTVTHAHVLATPGMDSHGAYVALSRHRADVHLHYGRDDFANQSKLVRTLSRERGKDMVSDYKPETDLAVQLRKAFAERRGITVGERIMQIARQVPQRAKSIFAGFRPHARKLEPMPPEQAGMSGQRRAVERFVRATGDIVQMQQQGLPVLPHQRDALAKATSVLDAIRAHAAADLASAVQRQPELIREVAEGRSQGAVRAMQAEADVRADPALRADRFVTDWQRLGQARQAMQRDGDTKGAQRLTTRMADMAKGLERDAQVESLLRGRTSELGIKTEPGRDLARDLAASITMERSRSIGMGL